MPTPPPQTHAKGQRPALDLQWLAYLNSGGDPGNGALLARSASFQQGIAQFNDRQFRNAHDSFEAAWRDTPYPDRLLALALAKLTASIAKAGEQGAIKPPTSAAKFFSALPTTYAGIDLSPLRDALGTATSSTPLRPLISALKQ